MDKIETKIRGDMRREGRILCILIVLGLIALVFGLGVMAGMPNA